MFKEFFLAFIVSIDIYLASSACCNSGIKIPLRSAFIIDLFSTVVMFISLSLSDIISEFITSETCHIIGTVLLIALGTLNIIKSLIRNIIRHISEKGSFSLKIGEISIFMNFCLSNAAVDIEDSKLLSTWEAFFLALTSSLDVAATGLSCGNTKISEIYAALATFICGAAAITLGSLTGRKISSLRHDFSWLGGFLLILFAVLTA
ncbi:manganese efflux pump [Ruminococcus sp.]|uniref:manganese efflux pump n=1 Tax=Ruminococcus sp. TaxID=41978 RepID=UPI0025F33177|nr:manganese efflux pump [Ruminococcus sp.]